MSSLHPYTGNPEPSAESYTRVLPPRAAAAASRAGAVDAAAAVIAAASTEPRPGAGPRAGYTYLGQFVVHETSFLPEFENHAARAWNRRTAALELDSLYGALPAAESGFFSADPADAAPVAPCLFFRLGRALDIGPQRLPTFDLPRDDHGEVRIGDRRNEENALTAQMHGLWMQFHNAVVRALAPLGLPPDEHFARARRLVTWHFQAIVLGDLLARLCDPAVVDDYLQGRLSFGLGHHAAHAHGLPRVPNRMPIEVAAAALRLHPLVRESYVMARWSLHGAQAVTRLLSRRATPMADRVAIDWDLFFDVPGAPPVNDAAPLGPRVATALTGLADGGGAGTFNLVARTLARGERVGLQGGQAYAAHHVARGLITQADADRVADALAAAPHDDTIRTDTPLWLWLMAEAEVDPRAKGRHLGPVGSHLVCDALLYLALGTPGSLLDPDVDTAELARLGGAVGAGRPRYLPLGFTMPALLDFVAAHP